MLNEQPLSNVEFVSNFEGYVYQAAYSLVGKKLLYKRLIVHYKVNYRMLLQITSFWMLVVYRFIFEHSKSFGLLQLNKSERKWLIV